MSGENVMSGQKRAAEATDGRVADRRGFMKLAGATAAGAGATAVVTPAAATEADRPADALYRETEHVKRYYALAR